MSGDLALDIAGIGIALSSDHADLPIAAEGAVRKFVGDGAPVEVRVRATWGEPVEPPPADLLFDSGKGLWRLYRDGRSRRFVFTSPSFGAQPYQAARFNDDFTEGEVEVRREVFGTRLPLYPLHYPLDELLMVHLLARGRGIEIHGSGMVGPDGLGTLFAGQSGAGKTTMARLWLGEPDVTILSDERVILRREGETIWMYGTPWHGDGHIVNPGRGRLTRIFFLRHAPANAVTPLSATQAIARLFSCGFAPFHDRGGLDYSLGFMEQIAHRCRCEELSFVPDQSAVDFVRARG
jgi:hypothetical protein